ncbi:uncharacterized protein [Euphorbia lathyris]|uniref:uncharacterized protein isoform X2 n=1 Tax=Euphorbia lathyris TaxID=212925 RepID=UPI0033131291
MDPRFTGEMLKHLERQNELLLETYNSMSHELHKLQVEEEMLMRKFYELMVAQGLNKKKEGGDEVYDGAETGESNALLLTNISNDGENGNES